MATFPSSPVPNYPLEVEPEWTTLVSELGAGGEQRRRKHLYPRYNVKLNYKTLTNAEFQTLWQFYQARKGAFEAFYIYDLVALNHYTQYIGIGDNTTSIFDIPGKSTSSQTIYYDGIEQSEGVDYDILIGGGDSSSDRVEFIISPPSSSAVITGDFTGVLRMRTRFDRDKLNRQMFYRAVYTTGIQLKGLNAE